ncbi:fumarylacetoacetate hydrolase family protein [Parasedimentitalea psychrophila]|uniref:Fumarylacetoacetate hydrolase family protein n=1 Tax=Parasedimentitalea psychrophila TaxID=2997337 RepID=A0A9Y2KYA9_9RHOB|nr:fumarylacetoacetate hydrolase family protein [Parasedimentitalea psychrophila]WIY24758.1 fumarylacetoacetate hydrolase family protein [Parasedimentitalea psychrophila]
MKLFRFGTTDNEKPGVIDGTGIYRDASSLVQDYGRGQLSNAMETLLKADISQLPEIPKGSRIANCIPRPGKIICIGLNCVLHAKEAKMDPPSEPIVFMKASTTISGPFDPILIPPGSKKTDWEVELGVVIGKDAVCISKEEAKTHIAGYCLINDVSEREYQLERGGQWVKGKSWDSFCPTGPWMMPEDGSFDAMDLGMRLWVNGKQFQDGRTNTMIFDIETVVAYLSNFMRLEEGDLISMGTPSGVGIGQNPPVFLSEDDVVELEIDGLGRQRQTCQNWSA